VSFDTLRFRLFGFFRFVSNKTRKVNDEYFSYVGAQANKHCVVVLTIAVASAFVATGYLTDEVSISHLTALMALVLFMLMLTYGCTVIYFLKNDND